MRGKVRGLAPALLLSTWRHTLHRAATAPHPALAKQRLALHQALFEISSPKQTMRKNARCWGQRAIGGRAAPQVVDFSTECRHRISGGRGGCRGRRRRLGRRRLQRRALVVQPALARRDALVQLAGSVGSLRCLGGCSGCGGCGRVAHIGGGGVALGLQCGHGCSCLLPGGCLARGRVQPLRTCRAEGFQPCFS